MSPEQRERLLAHPMRCPECGHTIPFVEGRMFLLIVHHRAACHGVGMNLLKHC